jgi:hypothetical protein
MRAGPLVALIALRYRLLIADTRSSRGRVTFAIVFYLAGAVVLAVLAAGGGGAAAALGRATAARSMAEVVLTSLFLNAALAGAVMGIRSEAVFGDTSLRHYPLSRLERALGRHVVALLEPLWVISLTIAIGMGAGFSLAVASSGGAGAVAGLLLVATAYFTARILIQVIAKCP